MKTYIAILVSIMLIFGVLVNPCGAAEWGSLVVEKDGTKVLCLILFEDGDPIAVVLEVKEDEWLWAIVYQTDMKEFIYGFEETVSNAMKQVNFHLYGRRFIWLRTVNVIGT